MATATKVCRVCGKSYEACRSANRNTGVFRWQNVACSPECGEIYLERIRESRRQPTATVAEAKVDESVAEPTVATVLDIELEEDSELEAEDEAEESSEEDVAFDDDDMLIDEN